LRRWDLAKSADTCGNQLLGYPDTLIIAGVEQSGSLRWDKSLPLVPLPSPIPPPAPENVQVVAF